jgi:hypothetical protein
MKKVKWLIGTGLLMGLLSSSAYAGLHEWEQVTINDSMKSASGSIGAVRNSADGTQYIGCDVVLWNGSFHGREVHCYARDQFGNTRDCRTRDGDAVSVAASITSDSRLQFNWSGSNCEQIQVRNSSTWEPKR